MSEIIGLSVFIISLTDNCRTLLIQILTTEKMDFLSKVQKSNSQMGNSNAQSSLFSRGGVNPNQQYSMPNYQQQNPQLGRNNLTFDMRRDPGQFEKVQRGSVDRTLNSKFDKYTMRPASKGQFKKYIQKTQNVFYQQREEVQMAAIIKIIMTVLIGFIILLGMSYLVMSLFKPYEGAPPKHGYVRNKVLYCDFGYEKNGNQCEVQKIINLEAEYFATNMITELRIEYGDYDCAGSNGFPTKNVRQQIESNQNIELRKANLLLQEVQAFLNNPRNKKEYHFEYDGNLLWPTQKQYSYSCRLRLLFDSDLLWKLAIGSISSIILVFYVYKWYSRRETAWNIYCYLKQKVMLQDTVNIQQQNAAIERIGHLDQTMWQQVDKYRTQEQLIGFFEDDNLYWKRLQ